MTTRPETYRRRRFIVRSVHLLFGVGSIAAASAACSSTASSNGSPSAADGGGGDVCNSQLCPNDPPNTDVYLQNCRKQLAGPNCGTSYKLWLECLANHVSCGADGKQVDPGPACMSNDTVVQQCYAAHPSG
jgi:hypothetical protein